MHHVQAVLYTPPFDPRLPANLDSQPRLEMLRQLISPSYCPFPPLFIQDSPGNSDAVLDLQNGR